MFKLRYITLSQILAETRTDDPLGAVLTQQVPHSREGQRGVYTAVPGHLGSIKLFCVFHMEVST